jgi:hypothetical protein
VELQGLTVCTARAFPGKLYQLSQGALFNTMSVIKTAKTAACGYQLVNLHLCTSTSLSFVPS